MRFIIPLSYLSPIGFRKTFIETYWKITTFFLLVFARHDGATWAYYLVKTSGVEGSGQYELMSESSF